MTDTLSAGQATDLPSSAPSPTAGDLPSETITFTPDEQPVVDRLPAGTTAVDTGAGGLAALDSSGALVRGWGNPGGGASLLARGDDVVLQPGAQTSSPATIPVVTRLIEREVWTTADGRPRLKVTPTGWGRTWRSTTLVHAAWLQVVAGEPSADSAGMENQYRCHAEFAPTKTRFNLEPWRPAQDYLSVLLAGCNPGGPEPP